MGYIRRVLDTFEAWMNGILEEAEDPNAMLDLMYQKQLEGLLAAKNNATNVRTSIILIRTQKEEAEAKIKVQEGKAKDALAAGDEKKAMSACERKLILEKFVADTEKRLTAAKESEKALIDTIQVLGGKVETIKLKKETMKAQYNCVKAQANINAAITGLDAGSIGDTIKRVQDKTDKEQARMDAIQGLIQEGVLKNQVDDDMDTEVSETDVKAELERIRTV